jgi:hypothetical protein
MQTNVSPIFQNGTTNVGKGIVRGKGRDRVEADFVSWNRQIWSMGNPMPELISTPTLQLALISIRGLRIELSCTLSQLCGPVLPSSYVLRPRAGTSLPVKL